MSRPLLICDADEVLLYFARSLGQFLARNGWALKLESFALFGNVREVATGELASKAIISQLIAQFFEEDVEQVPAVDGAAQALAQIATFADIVILTNIPAEHRERREHSLAALDMPYPVLANEGLKGARVAALLADRRHPVAFVDDLPHQHQSVAQLAQSVHRLHMVADPVLRNLIPKSRDAHHRIDDWPTALPHLEAVLRGN
jgi:hypothetical protein